MKKHYKLLSFIISLTIILTPVIPAYAYTEEEKQQVKEWLSANGYPATMEGAQQAYQDYLNGKFDSGGNDNAAPPPPINPSALTENTDIQSDTEGQVSDPSDAEGAVAANEAAPAKKDTATPSPTIVPTPSPTLTPSPTVSPTATPVTKIKDAAQEPTPIPTPTLDISQELEQGSESAAEDSVQDTEKSISVLYIIMIVLGIGIIAGGVIWYRFRNRKK